LLTISLSKGIKYFITPSWEKLWEIKVLLEIIS
jgi:hypothetical protein